MNDRVLAGDGYARSLFVYLAVLVPRGKFGDGGSVWRCFFLLTSIKTAGTKNRVAAVAKSKPPITARPNGAFCSPPSPKPNAIGTIPMIIAIAVMSTGR